MLIVMSCGPSPVGNGSARSAHRSRRFVVQSFAIKHWSYFVIGLSDMLFIYWGWDTA